MRNQLIGFKQDLTLQVVFLCVGVTEGTLIASFLFIPPRSEVVGCASLRGRIGGCQGSLWFVTAKSGPEWAPELGDTLG